MIPDRHRALLEWFNERQGQIHLQSRYAPDATYYKQKNIGVFIPSGLDCALSIRLSADQAKTVQSLYETTQRETWAFFYQIDPHLSLEAQKATRSALVRNMEKALPIGVMSQQEADEGNGSNYLVMGTAGVIALVGDKFLISNLIPRSLSERRDLVQQTMLCEINAVSNLIISEHELFEEYEGRTSILRQVVARQGQSTFRSNLLEAYENRCAVSGTRTIQILEAAHIFPYKGPRTNFVSNGLLLRSDLHTLFDLDMLGIEPASRQVYFSLKVTDEDILKYGNIVLREPLRDSDKPDYELLRLRWTHFIDANTEIV